MKVIVEEYYQNDLFKFMPEDMFDLLDEAYYYKKVRVDIPDYLLEDFENNKRNNGSIRP